MRFEPGQAKTVSLVEIGGKKIVRGGNDIVDGPVDRLDGSVLDAIMDKLAKQGFQHEDSQLSIAAAANGESSVALESASKRRKISAYEGLAIPRALYARMYGPAVGDVVRLADTNLYIRVESERVVNGDELKFGGGKVSLLRTFSCGMI